MDITYELFSKSPIYVDGVGVLHQPTIKEILQYKVDIEEIIHPFCVSLDYLDVDEEVRQNIKTFDLFSIPSEENEPLYLMGKLINALRFLTKTNNVDLNLETFSIIMSPSGVVNRDNFDMLSNIVLKMLKTTRPKIKPTKKMSERQRKIYNTTMAGRRRQYEKDKMEITDMVRQLAVGSDSVIEYEKILDMSYWQFVVLYEDMLVKSSYDEFIKYKSSGQFEIKADIEHWTKQIKVNSV